LSTNMGFCGELRYERNFEVYLVLKRTATHCGAFFGGPERSTNQFSTYTYGGTRPSKKYSLNYFMGFSHNDFDFDFGAGSKFPRVSPAALADPNALLDPGPGDAFNLELGGEYKPTNGLTMSLNYSKSRLKRNDTHLLAFTDDIYSFRSTYQFSRFVFARARIDYDTL